jgi:tetratricopeptide (TPR) repeat protein
MKRSLLILCLAFFAGIPTVISQTITTPRTPSPAAEISQTIGISKVTINYSRPAVRDREIWGTNLAHYGYINLGFGTATAAPWRAGANENTIITFSDDATIEGQPIPAGTYALFMGLHEDGKVDVIFSKNSESWGSYFYDEAEDQLRVTVNSEETAHTERLTFGFAELTKTSATCMLDWEKKRIPFKIEFAVDELVLANARNELRSTTGFNWQGPASAAQYALQNNLALAEAETWANQAVAAEANFNTLMMQSQVLAANGKEAEAKAAAEKGMADPGATANQLYGYGRQLINQEKDDEAMKVFTTLNKKWPEHWLAPHGMARAYSAKGDYKKALKYERIAITKCPEGSKQFLEGFIAKLENGEDFN